MYRGIHKGTKEKAISISSILFGNLLRCCNMAIGAEKINLRGAKTRRKNKRNLKVNKNHYERL